MTQAYCEVWQGGRRVGSALYDPDHIEPMRPYRAPIMQHDPTWAVSGLCTPHRYIARTGEQHTIIALDDQASWTDELPEQVARSVGLPRREVRYAQYEPEAVPEPQPRHVTLKPAPVVAPPTPAPIAVPNWPTRPTVVEPEAVPVVVNRTAARFGALEFRT
jgi:hypothetical protein